MYHSSGPHLFGRVLVLRFKGEGRTQWVQALVRWSLHTTFNIQCGVVF